MEGEVLARSLFLSLVHLHLQLKWSAFVLLNQHSCVFYVSVCLSIIIASPGHVFMLLGLNSHLLTVCVAWLKINSPPFLSNSFSLPFSSISCTLFHFSCCQTWAPEFGQSCGQSAYAPSSQPAQSEGWEQRQWPQCQHRSQGRQWLGLETGPGWRRTVHHTLLHTHTPPK